MPSQVSSSSQGPLTGRHSVDAASGVQVPTLPARLHASHAPAQGLSQHTPSTHRPDWHWGPVVQAAPLAEAGGAPPHEPAVQVLERHSFACAQAWPSIFFGAQAPPVQYWVAAHWASSVQEAGQAAPVPLQANDAQPGDPGWPAGSRVQAPSADAPSAALHTSHPPAQALLQQTPSSQWPDAHCASPEQAAPSTSGPSVQKPPWHSPDRHWAPAVQDAPVSCRGTQSPPSLQ